MLRVFCLSLCLYGAVVCGVHAQSTSNSCSKEVFYESVFKTGDQPEFRLRCTGVGLASAACSISSPAPLGVEPEPFALELIQTPSEVKASIASSAKAILLNPTKEVPELQMGLLDLQILSDVAKDLSACRSYKSIPVLHTVCGLGKDEFPHSAVYFAAPVCESCQILYPFVLKKVN